MGPELAMASSPGRSQSAAHLSLASPRRTGVGAPSSMSTGSPRLDTVLMSEF